MADELPGWTAAVHRVLTEAILLAGVPRPAAIVNGTAWAALGFGLHWWPALPLGILAHLGAAWLTKRDPQWFEVLLEHLREHHFYDV
jgi:type IV secretion system protein VirB3